MSDKRYVVPDGMAKAALEFYLNMPGKVPLTPTGERDLRLLLEAALRWLAENPVVPTDAQCGILRAVYERTGPSFDDAIQVVAVEWQRIMFLAPEPVLPSELIGLIHGQDSWKPADILAAYRLGRESKEKP